MMRLANPSKTIHFGLKQGSTYIDHQDKIKRKNYLARHIVNENWNEINAGSASAIILWGDNTDIIENLKDYLKKFNIEVPLNTKVIIEQNNII
jgi:hypothetical protein